MPQPKPRVTGTRSWNLLHEDIPGVLATRLLLCLLLVATAPAFGKGGPYNPGHMLEYRCPTHPGAPLDGRAALENGNRFLFMFSHVPEHGLRTRFRRDAFYLGHAETCCTDMRR